MDEEQIRDLIKDVVTHGESIPTNMSGSDLRARAGSNTDNPPNRRKVASGGGRKGPFGHAAAMAWFAGIAALVAAAIVLVGVPSAKHPISRSDATSTTSTTPKPSTTIVRPSVSQSALGRAVATTDAAGNFDLSFVLTGGTGLASSGLTGSGAADLDPIAMTLNNVAGATLSFGPDNAWEQLGAPGWQEYTIPAFSAYAVGIVGTTAGALGTFAFCSPTGLFDLTQNSIGPTTEVGPATVDGQSTTEYQVSIDPSSFLDSPGITSGEAEAMQSAINLLPSGSITDDVYIDAADDIVRTVSSVDGASLQDDLSNFGGAGTVTLPPQQSQIDTSTSLDPPTEYCSTDVTGGGGAATGNEVTTTTTSPESSTTDPCINPSFKSSTVTTLPSTTTAMSAGGG
jgi:hypothetical protein